MDHNFDFRGMDKAKCGTCKHDFISHSKTAATCESCSNIGEVFIFGEISNPKHMLLCQSCIDLELKAAVTSIENEPEENKQLRIDQMNERINLAKEQDALIRYNGDFFNAKVIAHETIRQEINNTEGLTADEKAFKFQNFLADRISHLKQVVFKLDEEKHQAVTEELVARKTLREMEKELRSEIRTKLKEIDSQYDIKIAAKAVKPKVKAPTLGTYDRLVQMYMGMHNCTREQAIDAITKGSGGKLTNELPK